MYKRQTTPAITINSSVSGGGVPGTINFQAEYVKGCTNSEIKLTKAGSAWTSFGIDGSVVNNVNATYSSYTTTSNSPYVYYTSTGEKDITIGSDIYQDQVFIKQVRSIPVITVSADTICTGESINLSLIHI